MRKISYNGEKKLSQLREKTLTMMRKFFNAFKIASVVLLSSMKRVWAREELLSFYTLPLSNSVNFMYVCSAIK